MAKLNFSRRSLGSAKAKSKTIGGRAAARAAQNTDSNNKARVERAKVNRQKGSI